MATARNPITGDLISTGGNSDAFRSGWDRIFGKNKSEDITPEVKAELPQSAYFLKWIESERGYGQRVEGYLAFRSEEDATKFTRSEYAARNMDSVPDTYDIYENYGWFPISQYNIEKFKKRDCVFFKHIEDALKQYDR